MTLGDKIRNARESAGLTQEELGKMCGTTKQTIYKYEIGKITNIPIDRLEKIAGIVGVSTASLLRWEQSGSLKRVKIYDDHIVLEPENPMYKPFVYWNEDMNDVRILGKAVAFTSKVI